MNALLNKTDTVLEIGSGRGSYGEDPIPLRRNFRIFKGRCHKVIGIDVDLDASGNSYLDEFGLIENGRWPVADESIDLSICDSVLEHIVDPEAFFGELERVTKPGGIACIRTPNVLSYFGLAASLVPERLHFKMRVTAQANGVQEEDVFPTVYRCNTRRKLRSMLTRHGFDAYVNGHEAEPTYLSFSRLAYALGVVHQRFAPGIFKVTLLAFGRKKQSAAISTGLTSGRCSGWPRLGATMQ